MPSLSFCLITKNEERRLRRALESIAGVADEVIVTDTGSTDGTIELARSLGAKVESFEMADDLAAARNHSFARARGDWIFYLDADEILLAECKGELRACLADPEALAFAVARQDIEDESRPDEYTVMWQLRLFRNRPELLMVGRIHEHFEPCLEKMAAGLGLQVKPSNIRIWHTGFTVLTQPEKHRRNLRLLELELADRPGQFYYLVELGLTRLALGDAAGHEAMNEAARMVVDNDPQVADATGAWAMLLEHTLANPKLTAGNPLSRGQARKMALARFPAAIPLLWHLANEDHARGRFAECAAFLERILELGESHTYDRAVSFNPVIIGDDARLNLGVCYVRLGQLKKAERCFRALSNSSTRAAEAARNLKAIAKLKRR